MIISSEWYGQAAMTPGLDLPPWMGEDPMFEDAAKIILAINEADRELAQKLWYYLISSHLSFDQMTRLATYMVADGWHVLSCRMNNLADLEEIRYEELSGCQMARDMVFGAENFLNFWVGVPDDRYSSHFQELDNYHIKTIRSLFCLPWNMPMLDEESEFWYLLSNACEWLGRLGIGAVGYGNQFTIVANFPNEERRTQLNLEFEFGTDRSWTFLRGFIPCPDAGVVDFWAKCGELEPEWISFRKQDLKSIMTHLGLSPAMSRNEIEAAINTLEFSSERPS